MLQRQSRHAKCTLCSGIPKVSQSIPTTRDVQTQKYKSIQVPKNEPPKYTINYISDKKFYEHGDPFSTPPLSSQNHIVPQFFLTPTLSKHQTIIQLYKY